MQVALKEPTSKSHRVSGLWKDSFIANTSCTLKTAAQRFFIAKSIAAIALSD